VAPCTITFSSHYVCITKPTRAIRRLFEVGHCSSEVQRVSRFVGKEEIYDAVASQISQGSRKTTLHKWASSAHRHTHEMSMYRSTESARFCCSARCFPPCKSAHLCKIWFGGRHGAQRSIRMLSVFPNPLTQFFSLSYSVICYERGSKQKASLIMATHFFQS
jgi:hypothetical protein